jgi:acetyl esterase
VKPRTAALVGALAGPPTRGLLRLPERTQRRLLRQPTERDGLRLAPEMQLLLRLSKVVDRPQENPTVAAVRGDLSDNVKIIRGRVVQPVACRALRVADRLPARLYEPACLPRGRGLLVFYHGGGWVAGTLDTHDNLCRFLALRAGVRVLSVDYRLAPEARFPAAVDDAVDAFAWAVEHADALGADPALIGVGGDSAGGNLSAVVAHQATLGDGPRPAFALLIYPVVDFSTRRRSRDLFGDSFWLTDARMTWFERHYLGDWTDKADPRLSPLLADDLSAMPPTYLVTAGFDPLRDEGEEFAKRLADAGVPVELRRQDGLIHGFANMFNASRTARAGVEEAAAALRDGLRG